MKICIIGPTYPYRGGIAHYTTLLVQHLQASGHQARLYSYTRQYPSFLFPGKSDREPGATGLRVPCEYILDPLNPLSWWRVFRCVQRAMPNLLVLQWWTPYWTPSLATLAYLIKRCTTIKLVFICHNVMPHEERGMLDRWLAWLALQRGDAFIVHSEQDRAQLQMLLPHANIYRTHHPTYEDFKRLANSNEAANDLRRQLALDEKRVILFFGLVRPYKGLVYLLQAFPEVAQQVADAHLLVVGEWWEDKEQYMGDTGCGDIHEQITIIDRYIPNEELSTYFALANVVVLPYVSATQSGIIQLAFGFGTPVITTNVGGLPEAVQDGHNGLLVPPQDAQALAAAIIRYFKEDLEPAMRAHIAAEQAVGRFSWDVLVQTLELVVRQVQAM